eukprot:10549639-Lingulodinium_polyedra.AAC.1
MKLLSVAVGPALRRVPLSQAQERVAQLPGLEARQDLRAWACALSMLTCLHRLLGAEDRGAR